MQVLEAFEPRNELEKDLLEAQNGRLSGEVFMERLLAARVFMPVRDAAGLRKVQHSEVVNPITPMLDDGSQAAVVFTSPGRAKPCAQDSPGYGRGRLADIAWIADKAGGGYGVVVNPGCEAGFELAPEMLQQLLHH